MTALEELLDLTKAPDPIRHSLDAADLEDLQLAAANERLEGQRPQIPVLDQRCDEVGITTIKSREDLVPLLFSHATYKSYPASFVSKGQWDRLSLWLETVTTPKISDVDVSDVTDVDGWLERLKEHGYHLVATSGTTGKNSFLLMDDADVAMSQGMSLAFVGYPQVIPARNDRPIVLLVPGNAPMRYCYGFKAYTRAFARPGASHTLTDEPMRVSDNIRAAALRKAMADGSITPAELAAAGAEDEQRRIRMDAAIRRITDIVLGYRDEPQYVLGPWSTWWRLMELAREKGIPDGSFHPGTVASITGGLKGMTLPPDYQEQMARFLGDVQRPKLYSMSEYSTVAPMCEAGMYHVAPWMTLLMLDESGERLVEPGADGWVTGRVAFYDPGWQSRWGGIVSGDQAVASYTAPCECGRPGPIIQDSIQRYSELSGGADDKLTCGGTIEQYIRGVVGA
ncbi:MAG TPA: hypothetical protein VHC41_01495 [Mycobacteriales bacterium]|nr:hypothetical protein [Mycobacteriales bacterium]